MDRLMTSTTFTTCVHGNRNVAHFPHEHVLAERFTMYWTPALRELETVAIFCRSFITRTRTPRAVRAWSTRFLIAASMRGGVAFLWREIARMRLRKTMAQ